MLTKGKHGILLKRPACLALSVLSCCMFCIHAASQPRDAILEQPRDAILKEYLASIGSCDIPTKIEECDFILETCDSASLRETALKVFDHFRSSGMMGDENVAVHVADRWILGKASKTPGKAEAAQEDSVTAAVRSYADFNRESLLGLKAPLLPEAGLDAFGTDKPTVLWFFDTGCAKCRIESVKLADFFRRRKDCRLVTFCIGSDPEKWAEFIREHFTGIDDAEHLYDFEGITDFRKKYSVTATPRMFLVDTDGIIVGRMLDTESLEKLLEERTRRKKEAVSELFYQLVPLRGEEAKTSLEYVIDKYILCDDSPFDTPEDSLMIVGFAQIQKELLSKARPGTKIAALKVRGSLNGHKAKRRRLDRLGQAVIVFHTEGCRQCEAELEAASRLNLNVFEINVDEVQRSDPELFAKLIDSFDLTTLPFLIETDRRGTITRRYFSLVTQNL